MFPGISTRPDRQRGKRERREREPHFFAIMLTLAFFALPFVLIALIFGSMGVDALLGTHLQAGLAHVVGAVSPLLRLIGIAYGGGVNGP